MNTNIPEKRKMSLYEAIKINEFEGFDICDRDWDWGVYVSCVKKWEDCQDENGKIDWYNKFMLLFCLNVECDKMIPAGFSTCGVSKFIWENRQAIDKFLNEENKPEYTPKYWLDQGEEILPNEDGVFYEVYMRSFESLLIGNYCEEHYKKLFKYLTKDRKEVK